MKKNIWSLLQISWLVLAVFTAHNSITALNGADGNCSGLNCVSDNDCGSSCRCDSMNSTCYYTIESKK